MCGLYWEGQVKSFGIIRHVNNAWGCRIQIADTFKDWCNEDGQEHEARMVGGKVFLDVSKVE